jgi:hypothetical protein
MAKRTLAILSILFWLLGCSSIDEKNDVEENKGTDKRHHRFNIERPSR